MQTYTSLWASLPDNMRERKMSKEKLSQIWNVFQTEHECSVDRMLCTPALRTLFLSTMTNEIGTVDEEDILWALVSLRKRKQLPKLTNK